MVRKKIIIAVGARPNFIKASPLLLELKKYQNFNPLLVHTGQHYSKSMSEFFLNELDIQEPDIFLGVGSGTHAEQTGKIITGFEEICLRENPALLIVVGDVNSTIACALTAVKLNIPVAHIEAGLRSFDRTMPEEINRILTDQISQYLFTTCEDANKNLVDEGIPESKIFFVGNVMIDTLFHHIEIAKKSDILERLALKSVNNTRKYAILTLHRPSNVDNRNILSGIISAMSQISEEIPIIFPAHPRTLKMLKTFRLEKYLLNIASNPLNRLDKKNEKIILIEPLGYLDFLCLMSNSTMVLTDSGGIQEETSVLGIPCLTLRNNTERPITVEEGTNLLVGNNPKKIINTALNVLKSGFIRKNVPKYWDGKTSGRIVKVITSQG